MAYSASSLKGKIKSKIIAAFGTPEDDGILDDFCQAVAEAADEELDNAVVTVTSVTGVTAGGGTSGPGTGTVT